MKKTILILMVSVCSLSMYSQILNSGKKEKYVNRKLTIEPAIGTRMQTILGSTDIQLTNLLQYNITRKLSFVSHTVISTDIKNGNFNNVDTNYSYSLLQKFGIGTSFYSQKASSSFFILGGIKYNAYSGTLNNPIIEEHITTKTKGLVPDYGIMYNYKRGIKKYFFSARLYCPMYDGVAGILENATIEFGIGIKLK
ncbi:MAG: hypothetical protein ABIQ27_02045 [Flavobacterium sp.]|uniref:hypothetical protein n=1 Tax=Flavobacterium sp. TaxID=239 RepID=UPI0032668525